MKRIEFISPVEAMRGNLSRTKQTLLYAENDNPAWDAPVDKRSYARNYQPIFVGAKVAKSGRKYFAIKTKTAITITAAAKTRMALLAVSSEIANILDKDLRVIASLQELYAANHPVGWSYKRWMMSYIREGLSAKTAITFPGYEQLAAVFIKNPYIDTVQPSSAVDISEYFKDELLVKFWPQLANDPVGFMVGEKKGIAHVDDDFLSVIGSQYNVLGLTSENNYVKCGEQWVAKSDESEISGYSYVEDTDTIQNGDTFILVDDEPNA